MYDAFSVGESGHLVLVVREVCRDAVDEVFADVVVPREVNLITLVLDVTSIDVWRSRTVRQEHRCPYEPVLCLFVIPVERQSESVVEESCIESQVELL